MAVRELAHAKINLTLAVLGRRPDGYHELESLVTFADVHDVVTLDPGAAGGVTTVAGPFAEQIDGENLLSRVLDLLQRVAPDMRLGAVSLDKSLPVAAGLGGGSADAAALLRVVQRVNADRAASVAWLDIAARLGADVPVCLGAQPALMRGLGEKTMSVAHLPAAHVVLVNPRLPLSTADVFKALDAPPLAASDTRSGTPPELNSLTQLIDYMRVHGNDLEKPAMRLLPAIADVKAALENTPGCLLAAMSGSGPTCFGIFADPTQTRAAADRIAGTHRGWWVTATRLQGAPAA